MWKRWFWAGRRDQKRTCCQQQQRSNVKRRNGNATTMAAVRCKRGNNIIKQQPQRRLHPNLHIQHPPTPLAFYVPCIYHGHNSKPLLRRPFSPPCHPIHLDWPTVICVCEILTTIFHCAHHCCNGSTKQTTATKECPEFQKNQSQHTQTSKQNGTPHTSYLFNQLLNFSEDQMATSLPKSSPRSASTLQ